MTQPLNGYVPGNTNPDFIYLTGAIVSWWARIEGIMIHDIAALRTQPFSKNIVDKDEFPLSGKAVIKQWRKLIENGFNHFSIEPPNLSKTVNKCLTLLEHRNTLVHSFWPYGQNDDSILELQWIRKNVSSQSGVVRGIYTASVTDLDSINTQLAHLYTAVMATSFNSHKLYRTNE